MQSVNYVVCNYKMLLEQSLIMWVKIYPVLTCSVLYKFSVNINKRANNA